MHIHRLHSELVRGQRLELVNVEKLVMRDELKEGFVYGDHEPGLVARHRVKIEVGVELPLDANARIGLVRRVERVRCRWYRCWGQVEVERLETDRIVYEACVPF